MTGRRSASAALSVSPDTVLILSAADTAMLSELLLVAQTAILGVVASAECRPVPAASSMLSRMREWASSAADLRDRLKGGV